MKTSIQRNVMYSQAYGCLLWLQIGCTALVVERSRCGVRIEIATPFRWFRVSVLRSTKQAAEAAAGGKK